MFSGKSTKYSIFFKVKWIFRQYLTKFIISKGFLQHRSQAKNTEFVESNMSSFRNGSDLLFILKTDSSWDRTLYCKITKFPHEIWAGFSFSLLFANDMHCKLKTLQMMTVHNTAKFNINLAQVPILVNKLNFKNHPIRT